MPARNPNLNDVVVLERLKALETLAEEDRESIKILLRIIKGDAEVNGRGLIDKFKDMQGDMKELKTMMQEILLQQKLQAVKTPVLPKPETQLPEQKSLTKTFKALPMHQKLIVIATLAPTIGVNWFALLSALITALEPFIK